MSSYSRFHEPCLNLSDGWCNVADKQPPGYTEQMIAAYHNQQLIYAYKAALNPNLGKTVMGPYLNTTNKIVDTCRFNVGIRPSIYRPPRHAQLLWGYLGLDLDRFDKATPERIYEQSDTIHFWRKDNRWENCLLRYPFSMKQRHTQMTVAIYIR